MMPLHIPCFHSSATIRWQNTIFDLKRGQEGTNKQASKTTSSPLHQAEVWIRRSFRDQFTTKQRSNIFSCSSHPRAYIFQGASPETATRDNSCMPSNVRLFACVNQNFLILQYKGPKQATFSRNATQKGTKAPDGCRWAGILMTHAWVLLLSVN